LLIDARREAGRLDSLFIIRYSIEMLIIRLQRVGRKNDPSFRVVVADSRRSAASGRVVEILGSYDARKNKSQLNEERIKYWISKGAKTSDTIHNLLINSKIIEGKKINVSSSKGVLKKEESKIAA